MLNDTEKTIIFNRDTYGKVIREARLRQGLSQPQLAALLSTSKNYVSNWEVGRVRPDMNMIPAICDALKITPSAFFGRKDGVQLTDAQRRLLNKYAVLNDKNKSVIDGMVDTLLQMQESEMRRHCEQDFCRVLHLDSFVAAGTVNPLEDQSTGEYVDLRVGHGVERADAIITVTGDSMEPTFFAGDDLLVQYTDRLYYGEIGIILINGEGFVKEYRVNGVYSHNEALYPFRSFAPGDDVRCVGRVLGKVESDMYPSKEESIYLEELRS